MTEVAGLALAALLVWVVFSVLARITGAMMVVVGLVAATSRGPGGRSPRVLVCG